MRKFNSKYNRYPVTSKTLEYKLATQTPFAENETLKRIQKESQECTLREQREREKARFLDLIKAVHENRTVYYSLFYLSYEYAKQFKTEMETNFPNAKLNYCPRWDGTPRYEIYIPIQEAPKLRRYLMANEWMSCDLSDAIDHERSKTSINYALERLCRIRKFVYQTRKEYPNACPDFKMDEVDKLIKKYKNEKR